MDCLSHYNQNIGNDNSECIICPNSCEGGQIKEMHRVLKQILENKKFFCLNDKCTYNKKPQLYKYALEHVAIC